MANKIKSYEEAELIKMFSLTRLISKHESQYPVLLRTWLEVPPPILTPLEVELFEEILEDAQENIVGWQEEDLKMKFISFVLRLGHLKNNRLFNTYFEKTIMATVEGHFLKTKTDFMVAKGILNRPETPYFHFQEYKPHLKPVGDSMGQLLEAFLIAQYLNKDEFSLYGCEVIGKQWNFVVFEKRTYCISKTYDCTDRDDLLQIIAILRRFRELLEKKLLS